jgi:hypothetical protein
MGEKVERFGLAWGHLPASSTGLAAQFPEQRDVFPGVASPMAASLKTCRGFRRRGVREVSGLSAFRGAKRSALHMHAWADGTGSGAGCDLQAWPAVDWAATAHCFLRQSNVLRPPQRRPDQ